MCDNENVLQLSGIAYYTKLCMLVDPAKTITRILTTPTCSENMRAIIEKSLFWDKKEQP